MLAMLGGSMANILLDYVFIFPLGMGIFGAVLATGLAPLISMAIMSGLWGMTGVWLAFPATELVCALTGAAICKRFYSQSFSASR